MPNLLLNPDLWTDGSGQSPPPIWNGTFWEILPEEGINRFFEIRLINAPSVIQNGDTLTGTFQWTMDTPSPLTWYLNLAQYDVLNGRTIIDSIPFDFNVETPFSFDLTPYVGVERDIYLLFTNTEDYPYTVASYGLGITLHPTVNPDPVTCLPWWLCTPRDPPEPCPVRVNPVEEFVGFNDYDANFKFPLASSRKPMKIERPDDCIACRPTLVDEVAPGPDPDPEPECATLTVTPYSPTQLTDWNGDWTNTPDWFTYGDTYSFLIRFPDTDDDTIYLFQWNGSAYDAIDWSSHDDAQIPFDNYEEVIQGEWAEAEDAGLEDHTWSCVMVSTHTPV